MGRPTKLDETTARAILDALKVGCPIRVACQAAGVGPTTFKSWVARGKSLDEADAPFRAFRADVQKARAAGEAAALKVIHEAMPTTWQAAAWFLERSRPERWGRVDRLKAKVQHNDPELSRAQALRDFLNGALERVYGEAPSPEAPTPKDTGKWGGR